jgi:hypothetical protein
MRIIAEQIHDHLRAGQRKEYIILFVPRKTMICERALEELVRPPLRCDVTQTTKSVVEAQPIC